MQVNKNTQIIQHNYILQHHCLLRNPQIRNLFTIHAFNKNGHKITPIVTLLLQTEIEK